MSIGLGVVQWWVQCQEVAAAGLGPHRRRDEDGGKARCVERSTVELGSSSSGSSAVLRWPRATVTNDLELDRDGDTSGSCATVGSNGPHRRDLALVAIAQNEGACLPRWCAPIGCSASALETGVLVMCPRGNHDNSD
jgi:hypothetical protein